MAFQEKKQDNTILKDEQEAVEGFWAGTATENKKLSIDINNKLFLSSVKNDKLLIPSQLRAFSKDNSNYSLI